MPLKRQPHPTSLPVATFSVVRVGRATIRKEMLLPYLAVRMEGRRIVERSLLIRQPQPVSRMDLFNSRLHYKLHVTMKFYFYFFKDPLLYTQYDT